METYKEKNNNVIENIFYGNNKKKFFMENNISKLKYFINRKKNKFLINSPQITINENNNNLNNYDSIKNNLTHYNTNNNILYHKYLNKKEDDLKTKNDINNINNISTNYNLISSKYSTNNNINNNYKTINIENIKKKVKKNLYKNVKSSSEFKFPLIFNTHLLKKQNISNLPPSIKNFNFELKDNLLKDNYKSFSTPFSIIKKNNFNDIFQSPFDDNTNNKIEKNDNNNNNYNKNIDKSEIKKLSTLYFEKIEKINFNQSILPKNKEELYKKFKQSIISASKHFKRLTIKLKDFLSYKSNKYSFTYSQTNDLIRNIKSNNYFDVIILLNNYKYLVFDFDFFQQTPLHWAAKRNFYKIIPKLTSLGSNVNSVDYLGRTPLHVSVMENNLEATVYLILFLSDPLKEDNFKKKVIDYAKEFKMVNVIKKCLALRALHLLNNRKFYEINIQRGWAFFVYNELRFEMKEDAFAFIKEVAEEYKKQIYK